jgi:hypothetical protein
LHPRLLYRNLHTQQRIIKYSFFWNELVQKACLLLVATCIKILRSNTPNDQENGPRRNIPKLSFLAIRCRDVNLDQINYVQLFCDERTSGGNIIGRLYSNKVGALLAADPLAYRLQ